jgi:hypothetical protein
VLYRDSTCAAIGRGGHITTADGLGDTPYTPAIWPRTWRSGIEHLIGDSDAGVKAEVHSSVCSALLESPRLHGAASAGGTSRGNAA